MGAGRLCDAEVETVTCDPDSIRGSVDLEVEPLGDVESGLVLLLKMVVGVLRFVQLGDLLLELGQVVVLDRSLAQLALKSKYTGLGVFRGYVPLADNVGEAAAEDFLFWQVGREAEDLLELPLFFAQMDTYTEADDRGDDRGDGQEIESDDRHVPDCQINDLVNEAEQVCPPGSLSNDPDTLVWRAFG